MPLLRRRIQFWLAGMLGDVVLRVLCATWRVRLVDPEGVHRAVASGRRKIVAAFWHRHILSMLCACRGLRFCVPVSEHRDGEYVASVMERYGFLAVRGSTTRGAMRLIRGLLSAIESGWSCAVTPDGPRGPMYSVQQGFILLARRTGLPLYPVGVAVDRAWVLDTWDAFVVPKPWAKIVVSAGEELTDIASGEVSTVEECARLREALMEATERARRALEH